MDFGRELLAFMVERKKFWLLPLVGILGFFSGLVALVEGSAIAPFIYVLW
jgi:hypothetical protein